ncbi:MAG: tRNA (N6-threonylcarbamoyladenosine(37)-N6)-methyltransferase TrmO [Clostridiales bacterium]|nr:tRNA (N6-threonylcarbamoyladenosine(37)-N6)-methyltransferase TrmO [Clostridiales bacterium]
MQTQFTIKAIGYINSEYKERKHTPSQGKESKNSYGTIKMLPEYKEGIKDLKVGMKITVIFCFHLSKGYTLTTRARLSPLPRGVFSTRSPDRPNSLGATDVEIIEIHNDKIRFLGADMLDGSPVIDIKPAILCSLPKSDIEA